MKHPTMRGILGTGWLVLALAMVSGCEGSPSGGGGWNAQCLDLDGDGYGRLYPVDPLPRIFPGRNAPLPEPAPWPEIPCSLLEDVNDQDPSVWLSGNMPQIISQPLPTVPEGQVYSYDIVCEDADQSPNLVLAVGPLDDCGGVLTDNGDGTGNYSFPTDESMGGSVCQVMVICLDLQSDLQQAGTQLFELAIVETNSAPSLTLSCPAAVDEDTGSQCTITSVSDPDLPPNPVTCALNLALTTCSGVNFVDCVTPITVAAPGEAAGPGSCVVAVDADDGQGGVGTDAQTLAINEVNQAPYFTNAGPAQATEAAAYSHAAAYADDDLPANLLSCAVTADTCPWLSVISGCTVSGIPGETDGGSNCSYTLSAADGSATTDQVVAVAVVEDNQAPTITNLPATESGHWGNPDSFDVNAGDPDDPADTLSFSLGADTCSFVLSIDAVTGVVSWTCNGVETCSVGITVTDDGTPAPALSDADTLTIECTNNSPLIIPIVPPDGTENLAYSYPVTCTDPDGDALQLGVSASNSCGGTITVDNGDGTGVYSWIPTETLGGTTCTVGISCTDTQNPATAEAIINIIEDNQTPTWNPAPANLCLAVDAVIDQNNGVAADADIPNTAGTYGFIGCSRETTDCSFTITVSNVGTGQGAVTCHLSFTAPSVGERCSATLKVEDGGGKNVTQSITITVNPLVLHADATVAAPPGGPGFSWADAFKHPQDAITASCNIPGVQIWVKKGTYYRPTGAGSGPVIQMRNNLGIYGGFAGTETALSQRTQINANPSILDGETQSYHVVNAATGNMVDGFIIQNGNAPFAPNNDDHYGGGLNNVRQTNITIKNCIFRNNFAISGGGAIANLEGVTDIFNCAFIDNQTFGVGGAVDNEQNTSSITNCTFTGNQGSLGGALAYLSGVGTLTSGILWGNSATDIYIQSGGPSVSFSQIEQNGDADPVFAAGSYGSLYLNQSTSPCVNKGAVTAASAGLNTFTTSPANVLDTGTVDMGYHYSP